MRQYQKGGQKEVGKNMKEWMKGAYEGRVWEARGISLPVKL